MKKIYFNADLLNRSVIKAKIHKRDEAEVLILGAKDCMEPYTIRQSCNPKITIVNKDEKSLDMIKDTLGDDITLINDTFESYEFPKDKFDLIISINSLPFIPEEKFTEVLSHIKGALKVGGIFCVTFFGERDAWVKIEISKNALFHTRDEVLNLFKDMQVELFSDMEYEGSTYAGGEKHWHIYSIIAKKINK